MPDDRQAFNRRAVRPFECLAEGWRLIKEDYWFFVAISFVAGLIMYIVPFGIMVGPMICGVHLCLFRQEIGRRYSFETLFDGFQYFAQSLIATMIWYWPLTILVVGLYFLTIAGVVAALFAFGPPQAGGPALEVILLSVAGVLGVFIFGVIGLFMVMEMLTLFVYPLIVDRDLTGVEAIQLSIKAMFGNFWGVVSLVVLITLMSLLAAIPCYLGLPFVAPLEFAMIAAAYRQVFPADDRYRRQLRHETEPWDDHDPEVADETGIQAEPRKRRSDPHVREG